MVQNYKVYFSGRPVIFTKANGQPIENGPGVVVLLSHGKHDTAIVENAIIKGAKVVWLLCEDVAYSWFEFSRQFEFVQAAGGLVLNPENKVLFIYRMEKWDLPKGKVEDGESIREAALREVEEECSIGDLQLYGHLHTTWHTYIQKGEPMLKSTQWFLMRYHGEKAPKPQAIEGITEVRWLKQEEWGLVTKNTYPSIIDVLDAYKVASASGQLS